MDFDLVRAATGCSGDRERFDELLDVDLLDVVWSSRLPSSGCGLIPVSGVCARTIGVLAELLDLVDSTEVGGVGGNCMEYGISSTVSKFEAGTVGVLVCVASLVMLLVVGLLLTAKSFSLLSSSVTAGPITCRDVLELVERVDLRERLVDLCSASIA